jgi:Ser/Thr protein kinase RdoA (MazF antagonist)
MSFLATLKEKLARKQQERASNSETTWKSLVHQLADGLEPADAVVEKVLRDCGRTIDELAAAVDRFAKRRAAFEVLQEEAAEKAELWRLQVALQEEVDAFKVLQQRHADRVSELLPEIQRISSGGGRFVAASRVLHLDLADPDLLKRKQEIQREILTWSREKSEQEMVMGLAAPGCPSVRRSVEALERLKAEQRQIVEQLSQP